MENHEDKKERDKQYAEWLRTFRWDYWSTGTLKEPATPEIMLQIVKTWLVRFPAFYAAVGIQHGPTALKIHAHILVGGIGHGTLAHSVYRSPENFLRGSWVKHGHVDVKQFSPALGGPEYMIAQADDIEIIGVHAAIEVAIQIPGLGTAGASGLLALLYPESFGTVDQFVVKALREVPSLPEAVPLATMNPQGLTAVDGEVLVKIMRRQGVVLSDAFGALWTPRAVDKVLWTYGRN